jgi:hypothetical protein
MTRSFVALTCVSALVSGCIVLAPGDDDDDTEGDGETDASNEGGGVILGPPAAGSGGNPDVTGWSCYESSTECRCDAVSFSSTADGRCQYDWTCCVHTPGSNQCRCHTHDSCAAVVASMPGAELVPTCPPNAGTVPEACAVAGESCTRDYLDDEALHGCCDGLVCKLNAENVRVCQAGSDAEQAAEALCLDDRAEGLIVAGPLATSAGDLPFTVASSLFPPELTASGCPIRIPLSLSVTADLASSAFCSLRLTAGPDRDAEGRLIVHDLQLYAQAIAGSCAGFPAGVNGLYMEGGATAGTLAFEGASCETSLSNETCIAGHMVLTLDATLTGTSVASPDLSDPMTLTFAGASVELDGRVCTYSPSMTACPAQP